MNNEKNKSSKTPGVCLPYSTRISSFIGLALLSVIIIGLQLGCSASRPDLKMLIAECRALAENHYLQDQSLQYVSGYMNRVDSIKLVYETTRNTQITTSCVLNQDGNIDAETTKVVWAEKSLSAGDSAKR